MSHEEIWEELTDLRSRDNQLLAWLHDARKETHELREIVHNLTDQLIEVKRALRPAGWWDMIDMDAPPDDDYSDDRLPGMERVLVPCTEEAPHGD